jgi:hypothetical protein
VHLQDSGPLCDSMGKIYDEHLSMTFARAIYDKNEYQKVT